MHMFRHRAYQPLWLFVLLLVFGFGQGRAVEKDADSAKTHVDRPILIKVVVVTMFELGEPSGDRPGEFQFWVERYPLDEELAFPQGYAPLRINREKGVLGMVTGVGLTRAASSIMALGMDDRFDLSRAYWLVAGIAGVDPEDAPLGSAAWAEWLVEGDLNHLIDIREAPEDWKFGYTPLGAYEEFPAELPDEAYARVAYRLDPGLVAWAFDLTRDTPLQDTEAMQAMRARYKGFPSARQAPYVLRGDHLAASTFWHGELMNEWANRWVDYFTEGEGEFVTSGMEDTGTYVSLAELTEAGRADVDRLLVLRTASNFTMQDPARTAQESLEGEQEFSAFVPALEAAYRVGSQVVREWVRGWDAYAEALPRAGAEPTD
jgi:purine nucleoside permease